MAFVTPEPLDLPIRPRRLRRNAALRRLVAETDVPVRRMVQGHFVLPGEGREEAIASLPGIVRCSPDVLVRRVAADLEHGIGAVMLFGVEGGKDETGAAAADPAGPLPTAVRRLRAEFGADLVVMADVCLCAHTVHGHCGVVDETGAIVNDATVHALGRVARTLAEAGADFVCPSDMMDGRVACVRGELDAHGFEDVSILAYTAKYASAFYGPFRDAADSTPAFGDRRSHQMDPRNRREALRELALDVEEGADVVMVKPALAYLDVVADFAEHSPVPVAAYNVSGEYAMVRAMAEAGLANEADLVREVLASILRAGADLVVGYHASRAAAEGWLDR